MQETAKQPTCEERIDANLAGRLEDFADILKRMQSDEDEDDSDRAYEEVWEYPLGAWTNLIVTVQLSTGGPGDQFEVEIDRDGEPLRIRYRFLDWWDGAVRSLREGSPEWQTAWEFLQPFVQLESRTGEFAP